jgi:hypothetical protein
MYPLNLYFKQLLSKVMPDDAVMHCLHEMELIVPHLCNYLAPWHIKEVLRIFNSRRRYSNEAINK